MRSDKLPVVHVCMCFKYDKHFFSLHYSLSESMWLIATAQVYHAELVTDAFFRLSGEHLMVESSAAQGGISPTHGETQTPTYLRTACDDSFFFNITRGQWSSSMKLVWLFWNRSKWSREKQNQSYLVLHFPGSTPSINLNWPKKDN